MAVYPKKLNVPEAIITANKEKILICGNPWFNKFLLKGNEYIQYTDNFPAYCGDYFFYGAKNKPTGSEIIKEFDFNGNKKFLIQTVDADHQNLVNMIFRARCGFDGNEPLLSIVNKQEKEICDFEELDKHEEVFVRVRSKFEQIPSIKRNEQHFRESDGSPNIIYISDSANLGLGMRTNKFPLGFFFGSGSVDWGPSTRFWIFGIKITE